MRLGMTQHALHDFVIGTQLAQVGRNAAPETVPAIHGKPQASTGGMDQREDFQPKCCCTSLISPRFLCLDVFNTDQTTSTSAA